MYMRILLLSLTLWLSGCASIMNLVPSFSDPNQSHRIIDARMAVERINCASPMVSVQVSDLRDHLLWFELYSESRGRQRDVIELVHPIRETVEDMHRRYSQGLASVSYCEIKVRILRSQTQTAARAVLGRF